MGVTAFLAEPSLLEKVINLKSLKQPKLDKGLSKSTAIQQVHQAGAQKHRDTIIYVWELLFNIVQYSVCANTHIVWFCTLDMEKLAKETQQK